MQIQQELTVADLAGPLRAFWELSAAKVRLVREGYDSRGGAPVFTREGKYTSRGWTEWTQGFQFGSELLQYEATGELEFLEAGRSETMARMAPHLTHLGVHDHGFNNVSTYGALLRLSGEGRVEASDWERSTYELALKCTGAVQAARWTRTAEGGGYIYSFNGPHSLFVDTIRTLRALGLAHRLGHVLQGENDEVIPLLGRLIDHARATARYNVYYGEGRDRFDVRGRTAHESIFNLNDGRYRCPSSQQGFSPFTTWTRGLAWAVCGFPEQLEFLADLEDDELEPFGGRDSIERTMLEAALATCDFYIRWTARDGIPYWDTGAPQLHRLGDYTAADADPFNAFEPVDSSAAAIAAQGLLRLGQYLRSHGRGADADRYWRAGLTVAATLFAGPYLASRPDHQGLLLHSVYHWPNGWDHVPVGAAVPYGESSMWGDYHLRELAIYLWRLSEGRPYYTFFGGIAADPAGRRT